MSVRGIARKAARARWAKGAEVMPRFSERVGAVKVEIQIGSISPGLRNSIWNLAGRILPPRPREDNKWNHEEEEAVAAIAEQVLRVPVEDVGRPPRRWLSD